MTTPTPAIPAPVSDGDYLRQGFVNALISLLTQLYSFCLGGFFTTKPYMMAKATSGTIANATDTVVTYQVLTEQSRVFWPTSDGTLTGTPNATCSSFVVPIGGVYDITVRNHVQGNTGTPVGGFVSGILVNGITTAALVDASGSIPDQGNFLPGVAALASRRVRLPAGGTVAGYFWQSTGAARALSNTYGGSWIEIEWVGP